ncbi:MAG: DUF2141 domain-containing protein [Chitinivibrionales bacterium]|nr:DUF2141 domain-containing protein [Chitinivibrionales bacterium]
MKGTALDKDTIMNRLLVKYIGIFLLLCFEFCPGADSVHTISGIIKCREKSTVYLCLTDKKSFQVPFSGVRDTVIDVSDTISKDVHFTFENVPSGTYGLRVFQDTNGNDSLDKGMLGPKEPWTMSWNGKKPLGWPEFRHICFTITKDSSGIILELE